jgi:hypothetical protein
LAAWMPSQVLLSCGQKVVHGAGDVVRADVR